MGAHAAPMRNAAAAEARAQEFALDALDQLAEVEARRLLVEARLGDDLVKELAARNELQHLRGRGRAGGGDAGAATRAGKEWPFL